jgi:hypothetical protein
MALLIQSSLEAQGYLAKIEEAALAAYMALRQADEGPLDWLYRLKFSPVGRHPMNGNSLNVVEQVNQSWTWIAGLRAVQQLLILHPDVGGFHLAPDAHMSIALDIMSDQPGMVGAEVFAAVHPRNNRKLANDIDKLATRPEPFRYVFFLSPAFPLAARHTQFERDGVQVWSLEDR